MPSGRWLTPNLEPTDTLCRLLLIPIDDDLQLLAAVNGALLELTHEWNWEDFGTMTAAETAELMFEFYTAYSLSTNDCETICTLPFPFDIDIGFPIRVIRLDEDGHFEELVDGVWGPPTGDYEVPAVPTRGEGTATERKCSGAANALAVLSELYEQASDAFTSDGTQVAVYEAILEALLAALGAWAVGFAASGIGTAIAAFFAFYELLETITADLWTPAFNQQLVCILDACATDTGSVVTFDWECLREGFNELQYASGLDLEHQLLIQQVMFILSIIGVDGLNHAGATTGITGDCDECDEWCYLWDFDTLNSPDGWSIIVGGGGTAIGHFQNPPGYFDSVFTAGSGAGVAITHPASYNAHLTRIEIEVYTVTGLPYDSIRVDLNVVHGSFGTNDVWTFINENISIDLAGNDVRIDIASANNRFGGIRKIRLFGTGVNPFGTDNC